MITSYFGITVQFAYKENIGIDAIINLYRTYAHLRSGNTVRIMFFDFISMFSTIHPQQLVLKLLLMRWIKHAMYLRLVADYATNVVLLFTHATSWMTIQRVALPRVV